MERQAEPRKEPRAGPIVLAAVRIPRLSLMSPLGVLNKYNMFLNLPNIEYITKVTQELIYKNRF